MIIKGIAISKGYSIGKASVLTVIEDSLQGKPAEKKIDILREIALFDEAVSASIREIEQIEKRPILSKAEQDILETHIDMLRDPQIREDVEAMIRNEQKSADVAVSITLSNFAQLFEQMEDANLKSKADDIRDIAVQLRRNLRGNTYEDKKFSENTILIASNFTPSEVVMFDEHVVGFATSLGGLTSHTAVIAKSKRIPAIAGVGTPLAQVKDGDTLVIDAVDGSILVNPTEACLADYRQRMEEFAVHADFLKSIVDLPSRTIDGEEVILEGNISNIEDMERLNANGGQGVGLLRTEMLFMGRDTLPSEEEQFIFYKNVVAQARMQTVTIRTIDVGGDKGIPGLSLPSESNPFLGFRAIRVCLDRPDIFMPQLRAILRASHFGKIRIMFPMIIDVTELVEAKVLLEKAKAQLDEQKIPYDHDIKVGIMIETPAAAMVIDILAKEADFFSIGTNDLCQYTLAVDRLNEHVAKLYDSFNVGLLRLVNHIICKSKELGIPVSMCGELAADPKALPVLLGFGLREFSMSPESIPYVKERVLKTDLSKASRQTDDSLFMKW